MDSAGIDLVDVKQPIQHARHGGRCLIESRNQLQSLVVPFLLNLSCQDALHQTERLQRLAQVMARSG